MNDDSIPDPWRSAMLAAGFVDRRFRKDPPPSARALAESVDVSTTTITRMISGEAETDHETVVAVADKLGVSRVEVSKWVKQARSELRNWTPPSAVHQLTKREQQALTELIHSMAAARREDGGNGADSTAANRRTRGSRVPKVIKRKDGATLDEVPDLAQQNGPQQ